MPQFPLLHCRGNNGVGKGTSASLGFCTQLCPPATGETTSHKKKNGWELKNPPSWASHLRVQELLPEDPAQSVTQKLGSGEGTDPSGATVSQTRVPERLVVPIRSHRGLPGGGGSGTKTKKGLRSVVLSSREGVLEDVYLDLCYIKLCPS